MINIETIGVHALTGKRPLPEKEVRIRPTLDGFDASKYVMCIDDWSAAYPYLSLEFRVDNQPVEPGQATFESAMDTIGLGGEIAFPGGQTITCVLSKNSVVYIDGYLDTDHPEFWKESERLDRDAIGFRIEIDAILISAGEDEATEQGGIIIDVRPAHAVQRSNEYIGLDVGHHNSLLAACRSGEPTDQPRMITSPGPGEGLPTSTNMPHPILSVVRIYHVDRSNQIMDNPHDKHDVDELLAGMNAVDCEFGSVAHQRSRKSMDGIELAAKRMAASPDWNELKPYRVFRKLSGGDDRISLPLPKRLPAELLVSHLLHQYRMATQSLPTRLAISYPTMYSAREIEQIREVVQRAWLRLQPEQSPKPRRLGEAGEGRLIDSDGVQLMIDEASAAAFYYLFERILSQPGQFPRFRYMYPRGLNMLLFDCGGGTTDLAIVRARVKYDPQKANNSHGETDSDSRKLVLSVRGRMGIPDFGGDYITEQLFRLLKAALAAAINQDLPPMPTGTGSNGFAQLSNYLTTYADDVERIVGTRFELTPAGTIATNTGVKHHQRAVQLWQIAERFKIQLAKEPNAKSPSEIPEEEWLSLFPDSESKERRQWSEGIRISRSTLDTLIYPKLKELVESCNQMIDEKLVRKTDRNFSDDDYPEEIEWVAISGAASRYPLVTELLRSELNVPFINSSDEEFRSQRLLIDQEHLKSAVAVGLARVLAVNDSGFGVTIEFDSNLARRLPFDVTYHDPGGGGYLPLFRENTCFDDLPGPDNPISLVPEYRTTSETERSDGERGARLVRLYRRFPGQKTDHEYLEYEFPDGTDGEMQICYDPDAMGGRDQSSPFVMTNTRTGVPGRCRESFPPEQYLHPVQRGDL
ncbi:acetate and sugar kinases/Hsc70/actin family protein [Thalassoroseus pseudoceratinae]|uniref:hypothetical protein n=1 Tax=Thalassoroseus pseudoceratinae TaxID=2713176 RepID=UPI00142229B1|nr:hypothetical protein [Thalassoroseus pseudoceratinae]